MLPGGNLGRGGDTTPPPKLNRMGQALCPTKAGARRERPPANAILKEVTISIQQTANSAFTTGYSVSDEWQDARRVRVPLPQSDPPLSPKSIPSEVAAQVKPVINALVKAGRRIQKLFKVRKQKGEANAKQPDNAPLHVPYVDEDFEVYDDPVEPTSEQERPTAAVSRESSVEEISPSEWLRSHLAQPVARAEDVSMTKINQAEFNAYEGRDSGRQPSSYLQTKEVSYNAVEEHKAFRQTMAIDPGEWMRSRHRNHTSRLLHHQACANTYQPSRYNEAENDQYGEVNAVGQRATVTIDEGEWMRPRHGGFRAQHQQECGPVHHKIRSEAAANVGDYAANVGDYRAMKHSATSVIEPAQGIQADSKYHKAITEPEKQNRGYSTHKRPRAYDPHMAQGEEHPSPAHKRHYGDEQYQSHENRMATYGRANHHNHHGHQKIHASKHTNQNDNHGYTTMQDCHGHEGHQSRHPNIEHQNSGHSANQRHQGHDNKEYTQQLASAVSAKASDASLHAQISGYRVVSDIKAQETGWRAHNNQKENEYKESHYDDDQYYDRITIDRNKYEKPHEEHYEHLKSEPKQYEGKCYDKRKTQQKFYEEKYYADKKPDQLKNEGKNSESKQYTDVRRNYERNPYKGKYYENTNTEKTHYVQREYEQKSNEQTNYEQKTYQQRNYEQKNYEQKNYEQKNYEQKNHEQKNHEQKRGVVGHTGGAIAGDSLHASLRDHNDGKWKSSRRITQRGEYRHHPYQRECHGDKAHRETEQPYSRSDSAEKAHAEDSKIKRGPIFGTFMPRITTGRRAQIASAVNVERIGSPVRHGKTYYHREAPHALQRYYPEHMRPLEHYSSGNKTPSRHWSVREQKPTRANTPFVVDTAPQDPFANGHCDLPKRGGLTGGHLYSRAVKGPTPGPAPQMGSLFQATRGEKRKLDNIGVWEGFKVSRFDWDGRTVGKDARGREFVYGTREQIEWQG
ncbi:hypothetical protein EV426DRAFT_577147 [Tirmania nivea]|nr:hypothetical protein EV426DRAFT_577147 [Tirmania nivea]